MSKIDTRLPALEREALLEEVKDQLPAFLSSSASEKAEVLHDVTALLNLSDSDLSKVIAVHLGLCTEIRSFVSGLPRGLRAPITSSLRTTTRSQAIRGSVDWGETTRHRAAGGALTNEYVIRSARRAFDTPENQALRYLLERLDLELRRVVPAQTNDRIGTHNNGWLDEIAASISQVQAARKHHWLREVPSKRPTGRTRHRLTAARSNFYKLRVPDALDAISRYVERPTAASITELLSQRYFEPERDWQLFELVVALRLAAAFQSRCKGRRKSRMMIGAGQAAYGRYVMEDEAEVWLWYQRWPSDAGDSAHIDAMHRYGIEAGPSRPDLVVQLRREGHPVDSVLVEVKASKSANYLGSGLLQLLGYLKDRPSNFGLRPSGWLVAPESAAFKTSDPKDSELWVVSSDAVGEAMARRFGY